MAISLNTDHSGLNKFDGPEDENFLMVLPEIQRMVQAAPQKVEERYRGTVRPLIPSHGAIVKALIRYKHKSQ